MLQALPVRAAAPILALATLAAPGRAQDYFGPVGGDFVPTGSTNFNQIWGKVATDPAGTFWAYAWTQSNDVWARLWNADGTPRSANRWVNDTLNNGTQDEPAVSVDENGHVLVAWSDRSGYDGELMGIYARVLDSSGVPLTSELQVNVEWQASQWRPRLAPRPGGGWVVAWSGQWDGEAFLRILDTDGGFLTGDVQVNTFENGAQVDTAVAVAPDGTLFAVFVDYSGFGFVGSGTNLWGRTFDALGNPQQGMEFHVSSGMAAGDQHEPRVVADGLGQFTVVWEDDTNDGGWGIFARRYDTSGTALGPVFGVNETTAHQQRSPAAAAAADGSVVLVWQDNSVGWQILARRLDAAGAFVGGEFTVNEVMAGAQTLPAVAIDASGDRVAFSWEGPGNQTDVFSRLFVRFPGPHTYCTGKTNSLGCVPFLTFSGAPSATSSAAFGVVANELVAGETGFLIYGLGGPANLNFHGGKLCVKAPFERLLPAKAAGALGSPPCDGQVARNFNKRIQDGSDPLLTAGARVNVQYRYRDGALADGFGDGLTDGLEFVIFP